MTDTEARVPVFLNTSAGGAAGLRIVGVAGGDGTRTAATLNVVVGAACAG